MYRIEIIAKKIEFHYFAVRMGWANAESVWCWVWHINDFYLLTCYSYHHLCMCQVLGRYQQIWKCLLPALFRGRAVSVARGNAWETLNSPISAALGSFVLTSDSSSVHCQSFSCQITIDPNQILTNKCSESFHTSFSHYSIWQERPSNPREIQWVILGLPSTQCNPLLSLFLRIRAPGTFYLKSLFI
jgi:hypothetical protein